MKSRTLLLLVTLLIVLGLLAYRSSHRGTRGDEAATPGRSVLAVADLNAVARVEIARGTQQVVLARSGDQWVVSSLWNHPAQFDALASLLRSLAGLKVGDVMRGGTDHLAEFGLASTNNVDEARLPTVISLFDEANGPLAAMTLGQPRARPEEPGSFSMPDSLFVRAGDGPVVLAAPFLDRVPATGPEWMKRQVLDVNGSDAVRIELKRPDGSGYGVSRDTNGVYTGSGSLAGQAINGPGAEQWMRAMQGFVVNSLADPQAEPSALGLDAADVTTLQTRNGLLVTAAVGGTNNLGERYARFSAGAVESAETSGVARATALQATLQPWTYVISASAAQSLALLREQLVAATNATPAESSSAP
jgi:hypothetical protein